MFLSHTPRQPRPPVIGAEQTGASPPKGDDGNTDARREGGKEGGLNGEVRDNDTLLQFREKHRAEILHHLIAYGALDLLLQVSLGVLLPYMPCLELVRGQRRLLLHGLVVRFRERQHRLCTRQRQAHA